jgi:hypothetical protein
MERNCTSSKFLPDLEKCVAVAYKARAKHGALGPLLPDVRFAYGSARETKKVLEEPCPCLASLTLRRSLLLEGLLRSSLTFPNPLRMFLQTAFNAILKSFRRRAIRRPSYRNEIEYS